MCRDGSAKFEKASPPKNDDGSVGGPAEQLGTTGRGSSLRASVRFLPEEPDLPRALEQAHSRLGDLVPEAAAG